ncbi:MAG: hypothetical protein JW993_06345 [Sedimentisphaerales bacterium]|nr:hypothetical protein [Sedimentisphaerales bacterium]
MVEGDSARHPCVLVVGDALDELVAQTLRVANEYEVDVTRCDDIYWAVAELAGRRHGSVLLVGRFGALAREHGRLFVVSVRNGARCCCLLDRDNPSGQDRLLAAGQAGVVFIGRVEEVESILVDWLAGHRCRDGVGGCWLTDDEFRATEAELNALLGREVDD